MAHLIDENVQELLKDLAVKISKFQEDSAIVKHIHRHMIAELQVADSMFFVTQKEIDVKIESLSEKFIFHGFLKQASELKRLYEMFVSKNCPKDELRTRLNVMKLLLSLSESPTRFLATCGEEYKSYVAEKEEDIDWGNYLKEGVERWTPPPESDSEEWTDEDSATSATNELTDDTDSKSNKLIFESKSDVSVRQSDYSHNSSRNHIMETVQNGWFNMDYVCMLPTSTNIDANIASQWHEYLVDSTSGLLKIDEPSVISEYKIIREIIWQFWECHNGVAYKLCSNKLKPKENVTIASTRSVSCQTFLEEFLPYIEMLQDFRDFEGNINSDGDQFAVYPPDTYKSYCESVKNILRPTMKALIELEMKISKQEETTTLLSLADVCRDLFKPLKILRDIHEKVVADYTSASHLHCATNLLDKLHKGLLYSDIKAEQDVYLCLYLESLYKYLCIIDDWLNKGDFGDGINEFPILDCNPKEARSICEPAISTDVGNQDWQMEFVVQQVEGDVMNDGLLHLICTKVLQIGKNVHLLRLLGKLHLISDVNARYSESLYEELVNKVLEEIGDYFNNRERTKENPATDAQAGDQENFAFPAICSDFCKYPTEMDRLENLVDPSDGFLMEAFDTFFVENVAKEETREVSLYERIKQLTTQIFPVQQVIENVFSEILKRRYSESGQMVKNLLRNEYKLDKHLELLSHVFLFKDDVIFPFYRRLFDKLDSCVNWGNDIWLTSHLQDILMDLHPDTYDRLSVLVKDTWREHLGDPLMSSSLFRIQYRIEWPVNIIIRSVHLQMYKELYFFIFQIKWALYTLNHLHFKDIELRNRDKRERTARITRMRLKVLRFNLVNIFSTIQHYVLGYVYNRCALTFRDDYRNSYDLDSLIGAHSRFITNMHRDASFLRDFNEKTFGFFMLLYLVKKLRVMWQNTETIEERQLLKAENGYRECHSKLFNIINPSDCL